MSAGRCVAYVDLDAVRSNLGQIRTLSGKSVWAVVKADGYGLGGGQIARALEGSVLGFAVATTEEGEKLRHAGVRSPVLLLGGVAKGEFDPLFESRLTPSAFSPSYLKDLAREAKRRGKILPVHLAFDTGMRRLGFRADGQGVGEALDGTGEDLRVQGAYTHFATAGEDGAFYAAQCAAFKRTLVALEAGGVRPPFVHSAASAAALLAPAQAPGAARVGLALYGVSPSEKEFGLLPVVQWEAEIVHILKIDAGEGVGYGLSYLAETPRTLAVLSVGYGDGYPRSADRAKVLIHGKEAKVRGRICMDLMTVDVSDIEGVRCGDRAVLLGQMGENEITPRMLAEWAGRIPYEILSGISGRVKREYRSEQSRS